MLRNTLQAAATFLVAITFLNAPTAQAATPSEMLEKAIYTEETVGNVDEAIKLYEQVIAEGKTARNAAAQAQFRLAQCLVKKNKQADANAALEKLIKDYPDEAQLVAKARKLLPSKLELLAAPWQDHEALQLNLKLPTGLEVGTFVYMIDSAKHDGKDAWRCSTRSMITLNGLQGYSEVLAEKESFAPISSRWMHSLLGDVAAQYKPGAVELKDLRKNTTREITLDEPVFDNEQGVELFRRLPLAVGYKTGLPLVATLGAGKLSIEAEVTAKETMEVAAGKFECFKLVLNIGQTFWISTDEHRYVVKFEASGVVAELARISSVEPGKSTTFTGNGIGLTLPERWSAYVAPPMTEEGDSKSIFLLDVDATMLFSVSTIAPKGDDQGKTPKEVVTAGVEKKQKLLKDFKLREPGVKESTIAGQPAASYAADYVEGDKKMVQLFTQVRGEKFVVSFEASVAADQYDAAAKQFTAVVDSLQWK